MSGKEGKESGEGEEKGRRRRSGRRDGGEGEDR